VKYEHSKEWYVIAYYAENVEPIEDPVEENKSNESDSEKSSVEEIETNVAFRENGIKTIDNPLITEGTSTLRRRKGPQAILKQEINPYPIEKNGILKDDATSESMTDIPVSPYYVAVNPMEENEHSKTELEKQTETTKENTETQSTDQKDSESHSESEVEDEDQDIEYTHYQTHEDAWKAWTEIKKEVKKKDGRGAILIDCFKAQVTHKQGVSGSIRNCREKCIKRGFCMSSEDENPHIFDLIIT